MYGAENGSSALRAGILVCVKYNDFILKSKQLNIKINILTLWYNT